jgi:hypothetical protein
MLRFGRRLAFGTALALLTVAGAGFARASVIALDAVASAQLQSSAIPSMLGPVNELGRNGWQCYPERAAKAPARHSAELPADDGTL